MCYYWRYGPRRDNACGRPAPQLLREGEGGGGREGPALGVPYLWEQAGDSALAGPANVDSGSGTETGEYLWEASGLIFMAGVVVALVMP